MTTLHIFLLLFFGIFLFMLEIFLLPGMVIGIFGIVACITAIVFAYTNLSFLAGTLMLIGTIFLNGIIAYYGMKMLSNSPMAVRKVIDGKMNEFKDFHVNQGDLGLTVSALRPEGKIKVGEDIITAWSEIGFIEANKQIEVLSIKENKIFVKQI